MATPTFTSAGAKATTPANLPEAVFGLEVKSHQLLKQAYETYLANGRENLAVTKTRGLVRGGGKKPWKQKGTGRARFGSSRNPIWRGGGIVFGPTGAENYTKKLSVTSKRVALRQALSVATDAGRVIVIENLEVKSGKTKDMAKLLEKIGVSRTAILVVTDKAPALLRATANIQGVEVVSVHYLNVFDILNADRIVLTKDAISAVEVWLGAPKSATVKEAE